MRAPQGWSPSLESVQTGLAKVRSVLESIGALCVAEPCASAGAPKAHPSGVPSAAFHQVDGCGVSRQDLACAEGFVRLLQGKP